MQCGEPRWLPTKFIFELRYEGWGGSKKETQIKVERRENCLDLKTPGESDESHDQITLVGVSLRPELAVLTSPQILPLPLTRPTQLARLYISAQKCDVERRWTVETLNHMMGRHDVT